jgi:hypothetical protein
MALKLNVDSLDGIDEALRPLYVEKGRQIRPRSGRHRRHFRLKTHSLPNASARVKRPTSKSRPRRGRRLGKTPEEIAGVGRGRRAEGPDRSRAQGRMGQAPRPDERQARARPEAKDETIRPDAKRLKPNWSTPRRPRRSPPKGVPDLLLPHRPAVHQSGRRFQRRRCRCEG